MLKLIIRDFTLQGLNEKSALVGQWVEQNKVKYPETKVTLKITDNYQNMYDVINTNSIKLVPTQSLSAV